MTKGEEKIFNILRENGINFRREVSFPGLSGLKNAPLRYDFGIYDFFGNIKFLIEYDGEGHFQQIDKFNKNKSDYMHRLELDRRKNRYALSHNITLIRIPYWDYEKISFYSIFNTPEYIVKNIFHNDIINPNKER